MSLTVTGYSGLFGSSWTLLVARSPFRRALTRLARRLHKDAELMLTLNGAAAGAAALAQRKRVQHSLTELGGLRTIETRDILNRNTTAADKTEIDGYLSSDMQPNTYPADAAGDWQA